MKRILLLLPLLAVCACAADDWGPLQFLVGNWTGEGGGQPGQGSGSFSFTPDLQGKILVRKNFAVYPAADSGPGSRHDDLMIVYRDESSHELRANYFDSEGHVFAYEVKAVDGGVVFTSNGPESKPRYRLTYRAGVSNQVKIRFEIAPPGKPFGGYIDATARRDGTK